jgi:hypothetical protein
VQGLAPQSLALAPITGRPVSRAARACMQLTDAASRTYDTLRMFSYHIKNHVTSLGNQICHVSEADGATFLLDLKFKDQNQPCMELSRKWIWRLQPKYGM